MDCKEFDVIKQRVCKKLQALSPLLTYHNLNHTLDVLEQVERIAKEENVSPDEIWLLKVAALYHDAGFLETYHKHEELSCLIFLRDADEFHFTQAEKDQITALIMATKVPQKPSGLLECIICDADLDYLGRSDFFSIGDGLRQEFISFGIVKNDDEWERVQIGFLSSHHYHTKTSIRQREPVKQQHVAQLV